VDIAVRRVLVLGLLAVTLVGAWVSGYSTRGDEPVRAILGLVQAGVGGVVLSWLLIDLARRAADRRASPPELPPDPRRDGRG
jgi:hypothetical protein